MKYRIAMFFVVQLLAVTTCWLAGYDFDRRGVDVALAFFYMIGFGMLAASYPGLGAKK